MEFDDYAQQNIARLLATATLITGDHSTAQDVIQEVLIKAYRKWPHIRGLENVDAYLYRMTVNQYLSWRRTWVRAAYLPTDPKLTPSIEPSHSYSEKRPEDDMSVAIARLPRKQKIVIVLRYYLDLSDGDIASILGCKETTVRGYSMRALRALRVDPEVGRYNNIAITTRSSNAG